MKIKSIAVILLCLSLAGCVESNFLLAEDSRLPKWMQLPAGYKRADVTVSLFLYSGSSSRLIMRGPAPKRKLLLSTLATVNRHEVTLQEAKRRGDRYDFSPAYYSATFKGVNDIIKFPCRGPVFWMADTVDVKISTFSPNCPNVDASRIYDLIGSPNPWW